MSARTINAPVDDEASSIYRDASHTDIGDDEVVERVTGDPRRHVDLGP
jgi:hypothetical protein